MNSKNAEPIYIVYGNHGKSPGQLEDYMEYLTQALGGVGFVVYLSENPVPGQRNILIECFTREYLQLIYKARAVPGTRFDMIATEFITDGTFNDFGDGKVDQATKSQFKLPRWVKMTVSFFAHYLFPKFMRKLAMDNIPDIYFGWREVYYKLFSFPIGSIYQMKKYWIERYLNFCKLVPEVESVWCVTPHQLPEYKAIFGEAKIKLMPFASWSAKPLNEDQGRLTRDIDFLFTGSLTPYRAAVLKELGERGFNVVIGPPTWPSFMRDHFIARSKVCLQVRQDPQWKYPSVMRYHYLLTSGSVIVAEEATEKCFQEDYLVLAKPDDFVNACERTIKAGDFLQRGKEQCTKYYLASEACRNEFSKLIRPTREAPRVLEPSHSYN